MSKLQGRGWLGLAVAGASTACLLTAITVALTVTAPAEAADGTWERAWGKDVVTGGATGFEICTVAASCKAGVLGGGLGGELSDPAGAAVDAAGNVYVASGPNERIEKFDASGNFLRAWGRDVVTGGGTEFEICTVAASCKAGTAGGLGGELSLPLGVATDAAGNVYVAEFSNDRIQKFDSSGNFLRAWGEDVVTGGGTEAEICTVAASCKAGTAGVQGGEFNGPAAAAADAAGNVYIADRDRGRIQKFDSSGAFLRAWGKDVDTTGGTGFEICEAAASCKSGANGGLGGEFQGSSPRGVATDAAGGVYVADTDNNRIQKFDSSGNFLRAWGGDVLGTGGTGFEICTVAASCKAGVSGGLGGELGGARGVAAGDAAGSVYVADTGPNRIQKFDASGNFLAAWGADVVTGGGTGFEICTVAASCKTGVFGVLGGEFRNPREAAVDAAGNLYVADESSNRIQKFPGPPTPPAPPDTSAPTADVSAKKNQKAGKAIKVKVGSNEAATATATGKVIAKGGSKARSLTALAAKKKKTKIKLKEANKDVAAGGKVTLKLKPKGKKKKRKLVRLVKRGAKAKAKITVSLTDLAGNSTTEKVVVKLKQ